ncbi:glycoside hydrolase family 2 protein, partial [Candidatus Woesearchaeota archaeon]|nr:glycoside hydrolase family 2 protein [Candidatus Woesearchaeota archaeon]
MFTEKNIYFLHIERLDTIATVNVNGRVTGSCNNFFKEYNFPVTNLRHGKNIITIKIHSPEKEAVKLASELEYPVPYMTYPVQSPNRNLIRKPQCHSGWDWGPSIMTGGVYGEIEIHCIEKAKISNINTKQIRTNND